MLQPRVLLVNKDMGNLHTVLAVAHKLKGHAVLTLCLDDEGEAGKKYQEDYTVIPESLSFVPVIVTSDAHALDDVKAQVIITAMSASWGENLECRIVKEAYLKKIPVALVDDFPGGRQHEYWKPLAPEATWLFSAMPLADDGHFPQCRVVGPLMLERFKSMNIAAERSTVCQTLGFDPNHLIVRWIGVPYQSSAAAFLTFVRVMEQLAPAVDRARMHILITRHYRDKGFETGHSYRTGAHTLRQCGYDVWDTSLQHQWELTEADPDRMPVEFIPSALQANPRGLSYAQLVAATDIPVGPWSSDVVIFPPYLGKLPVSYIPAECQQDLIDEKGYGRLPIKGMKCCTDQGELSDQLGSLLTSEPARALYQAALAREFPFPDNPARAVANEILKGI